MSAWRTKLVIGAVLSVPIVVLLVPADSRPPVSVSVIGYTTNKYSPSAAASIGKSEYIRAVIAVTNNTKARLTYSSDDGTAVSPPYSLLVRTNSTWKPPGTVWFCGAGMHEEQLLPAHGFIFQATIAEDVPCKVVFYYSNSGKPSRVWEKLPYWLAKRLPWTSSWRQAVSEVIYPEVQRPVL